jgi:hypothetical protein
MNPEFPEELSARDMEFLKSWEEKIDENLENPQGDSADFAGDSENDQQGDHQHDAGVEVEGEASEDASESAQEASKADKDAKDESELPQSPETRENASTGEGQEAPDDPEADDDDLKNAEDADPENIPESKDTEHEQEWDDTKDDSDEWGEDEQIPEDDEIPDDDYDPEDENDPEEDRPDSDADPQGEEQQHGQGQSWEDRPESRPECQGDCPVDDPDEGDEICEYCTRNLGKVVCRDRNGTEIIHGDSVIVIDMAQPTGFMPGAAKVYNESDPRFINGRWLTWPCVVQEGLKGMIWRWKDEDAYTFDPAKHPSLDWVVLDPDNVRQMPEKGGGEIPEDDPDIEDLPDEIPEGEGDDGEDEEKPEEKPYDAQDGKMTQAQRDRFANLTERLFHKAKDTFGKTTEKASVGEVEDGIFYGEEINQTIEIESRGVIYRITFSAERKEGEES